MAATVVSPMSVEQNRATAIKFITTMKAHNGADESLLSDDFQWFLPNQTALTAADIKAHVKSRASIMPECPTMTVIATAAEGDRVALEVSGKCQLTNGKRYDNFYHFVILFRDGRIRTVKEYCDTRLAVEALT